MHKEVGQGVKGVGGSKQQHQPTSLCPGSGTLVSSYPISSTSILYNSSTVKTPGLGASLRPPTNSTARSVNNSAELLPTVASTLSFGSGWHQKKKRKLRKQQNSCSHQLRKRGHLGREAPSPEKKRAVSEDKTSQQTSPDYSEVRRMLKSSSGLHKLMSIVQRMRMKLKSKALGSL